MKDKGTHFNRIFAGTISENAMYIVILGPAYPYRGGIAAFNERIARQWIAEGHRVEIETFTLQYPSFLFPGKTQYAPGDAPTDLSICRTVNAVNPLNWWRVGRRLRKQRPDVLLLRYWLPFMSPCLGSIARLVRGNGHTRVLALVDNIIPHEPRPFDRCLSSYFTHSVDAFTGMSHAVLQDLRAFNPRKPMSYCPHPLYDTFGQVVSKQEAAEHLGLSAQATYLLFFGFIRDYKGLDLLLQAYADARIQATGAKLVVAGEFYNNEAHYRVLERSLGLQGKVIWRTDFVPDEEVRYYFSLADLVVQPYKSATQSGITQIAYHFEKPMLVTRVGGLPEIIPDGKVGYVVSPNVPSIAEALLDFCTRYAPDRYVDGIRKEKAKYSWQRMSETLLRTAISEL